MKNLLAILFILLMGLSANAQNIYQQGLDAYNNEKYDLAIELLTKVIDANEESVDLAYNFRGEAYQIIGDNEKAFSDYDKAIEVNPDYAMPYQNRGMLYQSYRFDYTKAMQDYNKAIKLNPKSELAYFNRASLKWRMTDLEGALEDYKKLLTDFNPNDGEVKGYVARIQTQLGLPITVEEPIAEKTVVDNNSNKEQETIAEKTVVDNNSNKEQETIAEKTVVDNNSNKEQETIAEKTVVDNNSNKEQETTSTQPNPNLNIFWLSPNPDELPDKKMFADDELITIKLKVYTSHKLTTNDFTVYINGLPANYKAEAPKMTGDQQLFTYINTIKLNPEINHIKVRVNNEAGSEYSKELEVVYSQRKPDLHVLSIGPKTINLKYTEKDANDFATIFEDQGGEGNDKIFAHVYSKKLTGEKATTNEIRGMIEEYLYNQDVHSSDMMLLFVSSHGFMEGEDFRIHGSDYNPLRRRSTSVSFKDDITAQLTSIDCKKIIFIDACHSGGARGDMMDINDAIRQVSQKQNISLTFTSSSQNQLSYEDDTWDNGAFTKALIDGMKNGKADGNGDRIVTVKELSDYVTTSVRDMVRSLKNELQEPSFINDDNKGVERSMPIYVVEE
ncbi:MAG: caspase family protein [Chitinophagales bacterium]